MKNILLLTVGFFGGLVGFGQSVPSGQDLVVKIIPGMKEPHYQETVEFKAYLYNHGKTPARVVNPNHAEPGWRLYKDEWLVQDAGGKKTNLPGFMDGADRGFQEKDITVIAPGDSLYIRFFKYKFDSAGKFTVKYTFDHNPTGSVFYKNKPAQSLNVFRAESNILSFEIKKISMVNVKVIKRLSLQEVGKEKLYTNLSDAFSNADNVYRLQASGLKQEDFNMLCKLKNLRELNVSGTIDSFPAAFGDLRLFYLTLDMIRSSNAVLLFPRSIGDMTELRYLSIARGSNIKFPDELTHLHDLTYFGVFSCNFETLPAGFGSFTKLESLSIQHNSALKSLPQELAGLSSLVDVDISANENLTQFPAIYNSTGLSILSLSDNAINSIPAEIVNLKKLTFLGISNNKLTSLPSQLLEMTSLHQINLKQNPLAKDDVVVKKLQKKLGKGFFF